MLLHPGQILNALLQNHQKQYLEHAKDWDNRDLLRVSQIISDVSSYINRSNDPYLLLEVTSLKLLEMEKSISLDALLHSDNLLVVKEHRTKKNKLEQEGKKASGKRAQLEALQQRIAGLIQEGTKEGKARVQAETTVKVLHEQINELRKQNKRLVETMKQNLIKFEEREEHLKRRMTSIQARLTGEQRARRAGVVRIIDRRITTMDEMLERERRDPSIKTTIDLSNIGITDDEINMISPLFGK